MPTRDPFREDQEKRQAETRAAVDYLNSLKKKKITLKRPSIFVPGWTDEKAACWLKPYERKYISVRQWVHEVVKNKRDAHFITFSTRESKRCESFLQFGEILKEKIRKRIGKRSFDLIGHSMGGLDAIAALTHSDPLKGAHFLITVATPHRGSDLGEFAVKVLDYPHHIAMQCLNLDPDQPPIKYINQPEVRARLLRHVRKLYCLEGTRDLAVMKSARFDTAGLPAALKSKVEFIDAIGGARHSEGLGITQDPRTVATLLKILTGQKIEQAARNYGYIYKRQG